MKELSALTIVDQLTYVQKWGIEFANIYDPLLDNTYNRCKYKNRILSQSSFPNNKYSHLKIRDGKITPRYPITERPCKHF
jgi:hypothetical protein